MEHTFYVKKFCLGILDYPSRNLGVLSICMEKNSGTFPPNGTVLQKSGYQVLSFTNCSGGKSNGMVLSAGSDPVILSRSMCDETNGF